MVICIPFTKIQIKKKITLLYFLRIAVEIIGISDFWGSVNYFLAIQGFRK